MQTQKAVCECNNMSEDEMVVSVQKGRFAFWEDWGIFTQLAVIIMIALTGGFGVGIIFGWKWNDIFHPNYICSQCKRVIPENQFRV